jgi:transposase-like protein
MEGQESITYVCSKYEIADSLLKKRIRYYKKYGKEGLFCKITNTRYDCDFKLKVILCVKQKSLSLTASCLKYNIPIFSTEMSWIDKYNSYGSKILYQQTRGKPMNK